MAEATVLLVDDDPALIRVLVMGFETRGYAVRVAATGAAALDQVDLGGLDVVILDLGLPDIDGLNVCRHLLRLTSASIIVLSADGAEDRKVDALDAGASDYLTKPFSMPELLARVRVALRHRRAVSSLLGDELLQVGLLRIDPGGHEALLVDEPMDLTPKEFALLTLLARNAGRVLTHRMILDQVWGPDQALDTLRTHVSQLRKKLGDGDLRPKVLTAPGVGYRLVADVPPDGDEDLETDRDGPPSG